MPETFEKRYIFDIEDKEPAHNEESSDETIEQATPSATNETPSEEPTRGGFFAKAKKIVTTVKNKVPLWGIGLGTAGAVIAPACNTPTQGKQDLQEQVVERSYEEPQTSDSTYVMTADQPPVNAADTITVPTEWSEELGAKEGINKRVFDVTVKAFGQSWPEAYRNAYLLQDSLGASALQICVATRNLVAWTTSPKAKGEAKINSGILAPYGLENLVNAIRCRDTLIVENMEIYRSMVKAGNNNRLNLQVAYLEEINPRFSLLKHDSEGYLIGNTCNQLIALGDCGEDAKFKGNCGSNVAKRVEQVITQPDTIQSPVVENIEEPVAIDTIQPPAPVVAQDTTPVVKKAKAQKNFGHVKFSATSNVGNAPLNGAIATVSNTANESNLDPGTKRAARKAVKEVSRDAGVSEQTKKAFNKEIDHPNSTEEEAKKQQQEWTANNNQNSSYTR